MRNINLQDITKEWAYHNTLKLLEKYRSVFYTVQTNLSSVNGIVADKLNMPSELAGEMSNFEIMASFLNISLEACTVASYLRTVERSRRMLMIIDNAVNIMREHNKNGEEYYLILFYCYLSQTQYSADMILEYLVRNGYAMSLSSFYRKRQAAIIEFSTVLWGFDALDINEISSALLGNDENFSEL